MYLLRTLLKIFIVIFNLIITLPLLGVIFCVIYFLGKVESICKNKKRENSI